MSLRLLPYHARLAVKSLRRDLGLSVTIVLVLGVASGIFCFVTVHYLRIYGPRPRLAPGLHQVEIVARARALKAFVGTSAEPTLLAARTRISFPHYRTLSSSGIPARDTANFRVRILVGPADAQSTGGGASTTSPLLRPRNGRFVNADFFPLFAFAFRWGGGWSRADETVGAPRVVLGRALNAELFGGENSVGRAVTVDGRPFLVAGVLADHQPYVPEWDWAASGGGQDAIYVPFAEHERCATWPETPLYESPVGPTYPELLASDTVFVSYWLELPTPESRRAYAGFLEERLGRQGIRYHLRDLATLRAAYPFPRSAITFFAFVSFIVLCGGGAAMTRLLLAKGLTRGDESGIFRAVGAPRRALFSRQLLEGAMLSLLAWGVALIFAIPPTIFHDTVIADTDIPLRFSAPVFLVHFVATMAVGLLSATYPAWRVAARRPTVALGRR